MSRIRKITGYIMARAIEPVTIRKLTGYLMVKQGGRFIMTDPAKDMLLAMINRASNVVWDHSSLVIGAPFTVYGPNNTNTTATLTAPGYTGSINIYYKRVEFRMLFIDADTTSPLTAVTTMTALLAQINQRFGINLGLDDVVDQVVDGLTRVTLVAADNSYLLIPGSDVIIGQDVA